MTNFSLVPGLHQSQPANIGTHGSKPRDSLWAVRSQINQAPEYYSLLHLQDHHQHNCASSISSSRCRHSSDFKTISIQRANPEAAAKTRGGGGKLQLHVLPRPPAFPSGRQQQPQKQFRSLSSAQEFSHTGISTTKYPLTSKLLECAKSSLTQRFYFPFYNMFTRVEPDTRLKRSIRYG